MRLIDADALKVSFARVPDLRMYNTRTIGTVIDDAPTIDAVPVVRCKECVYRPCKQMPYSYDHDYCSYGERKEKMRLIDADALLAELNAINAPYRADINNAIDDAPTVDPVKHGRWELDEKSDSIKCSECGKDALIDKIGVGYVIQLCSDYCPYCGARMDGGEE